MAGALRFNPFHATTSAAAGASASTGPGNNREARWARVYEDWESSSEAESRTRQVLRVFNASEPWEFARRRRRHWDGDAESGWQWKGLREKWRRWKWRRIDVEAARDGGRMVGIVVRKKG